MDPLSIKDVVKYVDSFDMDDRVLIRDIIDLISLKGEQGIAGIELIKQLNSLYPERSDIKQVCIKVTKEFTQFIKKIKNGVFAWEPSGDGDITADLREAVGDQVNLTYDVLKFLKEKGKLSENEWAILVAKKYSMPQRLAVEYIHHVIHQFNGVIVQSDNKWAYVQSSKTDYMNVFKAIASTKYGDLNET